MTRLVIALTLYLFTATLSAQAPPLMTSGQLRLTDVAGISRLYLNSTHLDVKVSPLDSEVILDWQSSASRPPEFRRNDDALFLLLDEGSRQNQLVLKVPAHWQLTISVTEQGDITVEQMSSAISAWSARGDVRVAEHLGSFSVTAMDGDAAVSLTSATLDQDSAMTSWNGTLSLTAPADLEATLRLVSGRLDNSELQVFDIEPDNTSNTGIRHQLNGGGQEITLRSVHGTIRLAAASQE